MYRLARARRGASSLHLGNCLLFLALALFVATTTAQDTLTQAYCSSQNTAATDATFDQFQSNGACRTTCQANFALAIVQGTNCWCSNTVPADQTDVGDCNTKCPGYPFENCGNPSTGLFGYVLLNKAPSGSADAISPSSASSSKQSSTSHAEDSSPPAQAQTVTSSVINSVTITNDKTFTISPSVSVSTLIISPTVDTTPSSTPPPASSLTSISSSSAPPSTSTPDPTAGTAPSTWTPTPVTSVVVSTISNVAVTKTVTSMPTVPPGDFNTQAVESSRGPTAGLIAGIVFAVLIPVLLIVALGFCCWRRRRILAGVEHGPGGMIGSENPSSRPTRTTSVLSRTGLLEKVYPSAGAQRSFTNSRSNTLGPDTSGPINPLAERRNSRPLFYDQRLNPATLMDFDNGSRVSVNTLPDNRDFSRTLNIRNPDPSGWD